MSGYTCPDCGYKVSKLVEHRCAIHLTAGQYKVAADRVAEQYKAGEKPADLVNHPPHYTQHPSGVECIVVTEHMNFCLGNAMKYIWRAGEKGAAVQDLKKARWYIDREIARLKDLDQ